MLQNIQNLIFNQNKYSDKYNNISKKKYSNFVFLSEFNKINQQLSKKEVDLNNKLIKKKIILF